MKALNYHDVEWNIHTSNSELKLGAIFEFIFLFIPGM